VKEESEVTPDQSPSTEAGSDRRTNDVHIQRSLASKPLAKLVLAADSPYPVS